MQQLGSIFAERDETVPRGEDLRATVQVPRACIGHPDGVLVPLAQRLPFAGERMARARSSFEPEGQIHLRIPAGFQEGATLRLRGQGGVRDGGEAGDLLLRIEFHDEPFTPYRPAFDGDDPTSALARSSRADMGASDRDGLSVPAARNAPTYAALGLLAAALLIALYMLSGCASSTCRKIESELADFDAGQAATSQQPVSQFRLQLSYRTLDILLASQLADLPAPALDLPEVMGVSLGKAVLKVEGLRVRPAPRGKLAFVVQLAVRTGQQAGAKTLVGLDAVVEVEPKLDRASNSVVARIDANSIRSVRPKLTEGAGATLAAVIWDRLPSAARSFTSKGQIAEVLEQSLGPLADEIWATLRERVASELGEIAKLEFDLPDIPVAGIDVYDHEQRLVVDIASSFSAAGLRGPKAGTPVPSAKQLDARATLPAAASLLNWGLTTGRLPERWSLEGEPDPKGPIWLRAGYRGGPTRPATLHLFLLEKDCAHIEVAATPQVSIQQGQLVVSTDDAVMVDVKGSTKVKLGLLAAGFARKTQSFAQGIGAGIAFNIGRQRFAVRASQASLENGELVVRAVIGAQPGR